MEDSDQVQSDLSDVLETNMNVEKKLTDYLLTGMPLHKAHKTIQNELDDEAEADILDVAKCQLKSNCLDKDIKIKALYLVNRQLKRLQYRFHLHTAREAYEALQQELEKA